MKQELTPLQGLALATTLSGWLWYLLIRVFLVIWRLL